MCSACRSVRGLRRAFDFSRDSVQALAQDTADFLREERRDWSHRQKWNSSWMTWMRYANAPSARRRARASCYSAAAQGCSMTPLRQLPRLLRIAATLVRYRLDDLIESAHLFRPLEWLRPLLPRPRRDVAQLPRGAASALSLGSNSGRSSSSSARSCRRAATCCPRCRRRTGAVAGSRAAVSRQPGARRIETALGAQLQHCIKRSTRPRWPPLRLRRCTRPRSRIGREVVVKCCVPHIQRNRADIDLAARARRTGATLASAADKIRPREIVAGSNRPLTNELDLQREGANASLLRRNFIDGNDLIVPDVHWSHTTESVSRSSACTASAWTTWPH